MRGKFNKYIGLIIVLIVCTFCSGSIKREVSFEKIKGKNKISVGINISNDKFISKYDINSEEAKDIEEHQNTDLIHKQGKYIYYGYEVALANQIANKLNVQLSFEEIRKDQICIALELGKIDFFMSKMWKDMNLSNKIDYSESYFNSGVTYLVKRGNENIFTKYDDIINKTVGTLDTDPVNKYVEKIKGGAKYSTIKSYDEMLNKLRTSELKAVMVETESVENYLTENTDLNKANLKIVNTQVDFEEYALGIQKNSKIKQNLDEILKEIKSTGIMKKYYKEVLNRFKI